MTQAVFPEGGLSRDGRLRPPKLGILDYMVRSFDPAGERDIVFVPVGINYDRIFEDRSFLRELDPTAPKRPARRGRWPTRCGSSCATSGSWPATAGTASATPA